MTAALTYPENARNAALAATLICVWLTAHYAQKVRENRVRAYTALSLLALNWAVLLLYYLPGAPESEVLSSISGFALIKVGGLLYREATEESRGENRSSVTWLDTLPLFLFRSTVFGLGFYYLVQRLFHRQWGWGTLALALWGTLFSILGYLVIWLAVVYLYRWRQVCRRVAIGFGVVVALYSAAELAYTGWYVGEYWPAYSRYLALRSRADAPDFQELLPFRPQPDWPEDEKWSRLTAAREKGRPAPEIMALRVQPRVPDAWVWLTYYLAAIKLAFTVSLLWLVLRLPPPESELEPSPFHARLDSLLRLGTRRE